jgi:hypothetical protein
MPPDGHVVGVASNVPWWRLATTLLLVVGLAIAAAAGRTVDAVIAGILLVPSLAVSLMWVVAVRRGGGRE